MSVRPVLMFGLWVAIAIVCGSVYLIQEMLFAPADGCNGGAYVCPPEEANAGH